MRIRRSNGFSLIELLAAAAIIGVLATVAVPVMETVQRREKERALRTALRDIRVAIDAYKAAADAGRIVKAKDESGYPPNLGALASGVTDSKSSTGAKLYFLRRVPRDPFNTDASTPAESTWRLRSFASSASNPQPGKDVFDVYSTSGRSGLNGVPYAEW